jgi:pyruvate ferredoxin oxidoreductase gamma subunit
MGLLEVRWHGRGGQGVVTAGELLAEAALIEDKFIQAFPEFGPERRGAPVRAFTRISDEVIDIHYQVHEPDVVVVLDSSQMTSEVVSGLKSGGMLVLNYCGPAGVARRRTGFKGVLYLVDATRIGLEALGTPIVNTVCIGAIVRVSDAVKLSSLKDAVRKRFEGKLPEKVIEKNLLAVERGYNEVVRAMD